MLNHFSSVEMLANIIGQTANISMMTANILERTANILMMTANILENTANILVSSMQVTIQFNLSFQLHIQITRNNAIILVENIA